MAYILSVSFFKGGVGKTTTTITLGAALTQKGYKVLLVDLDPQANLTGNFSVEKEKNPLNAGRVILGEYPIQDAIRHEFGMDLLPSAHEMTDKQNELATKRFNHALLLERLKPIEENYDFILIDCPPSLDTFTTNALCASDGLLIPLVAEAYSYEGIPKMIECYNEISKINQNLELLGFLLTNHSKNARTLIGKSYGEEIERVMPGKLFKTFIPSSISIVEAQNNSTTVYEHEKKNNISGKASKAYLDVCNELLERIGITQPA